MHCQWQDIFAQGLVSFDSLALLLSTGTDVATESVDGFLQGGRVTNLQFITPSSGNELKSDCWVVDVQTVTSNGVRFSSSSAKVVYSDFKPRLIPLQELGLWPIKEEERLMLTRRGQIDRDLAIGAHHKAYLGTMRINPKQTGRADGRIMVDIERYFIHQHGGVPHSADDYKRMHSRHRRRTPAYSSGSAFEDTKKGLIEARKKDCEDLFDPLDDSLLFMTPPSLSAFSFRHHQFGSCHIELMSDIVWREDAWDLLVLPQVKKDLIRTLILQTRPQAEVDVLEKRRWETKRLMSASLDSGTSSEEEAKQIEVELADDTDIVQGKGGGCTMIRTNSLH